MIEQRAASSFTILRQTMTIFGKTFPQTSVSIQGFRITCPFYILYTPPRGLQFCHLFELKIRKQNWQGKRASPVL